MFDPLWAAVRENTRRSVANILSRSIQVAALIISPEAPRLCEPTQPQPPLASIRARELMRTFKPGADSCWYPCS